MNFSLLLNINGSCIANCTSGRTSYDSPIFIAANIIISTIVIVFTKILIGLFLWKRETLLKSPSNYLLFSLLKCNLFKGIAIALQTLTHICSSLRLPVTKHALIFRIFVDLYNSFIVCSMAMQLCGVTMDRYIALYYPYRYETLVTFKRINRYIVASWIIPLTMSLIQLSWIHHIINFPCGDWTPTRIAMYDTFYSLFSIIMFLFIPMLVFVPVFIAMFLKTRRIISRTQSQRVNKRRTWFLQFRATYMYSFMFISFVALVTPYFSLRLLMDFFAWHGKVMFTDPYLYYWTSTLQNLTPLVNSIFYVVACPKVQKMLLQLICFRMMKKRRKEATAVLIDDFLKCNSAIELHTIQTELHSLNTPIIIQGSSNTLDIRTTRSL